MCSPRKAGTRIPPNWKNPQPLDLIDFTMVLHISTCKFDATNSQNAVQHDPDMFWRAPGPENMVYGAGAGK